MTADALSSAFDDHRPPRLDLINDCVHCGFCLPTCPTYVLWGAEADSPRGRIHLMEQHTQGAPMTDSMALHFDRCLGCMACVTACPSGVRYDLLIEQTRQVVEAGHRRSIKERLLRAAIFRLFPYPRRLRLLRGPLRLYQMLGVKLARGTSALGTLESLAPRIGSPERLPTRMPAVGKRRAVVGLLTGCVQSAFFPEVNAATARVLAAEGCDVVIPRDQGCCGALSLHNGRAEESRRFAGALAETFERAGVDYVVVNAAGCGSATKEYLPNARDFAELLAELGPVATRHPLPLTVAYHDACHLAHAQGIRVQPRALLAAIPSLVVREIADPEICCGSAGVWNVLNPRPARELGEAKARNVLATGADVLVTANPGCLMQIGATLGGAMTLVHTAQILDASINQREIILAHRTIAK